MPSVIYTGWWFQPTPLKNDGVSSSVGMMTFRTEWKNKKLFQTTNQNWPLKTNVARGGTTDIVTAWTSIVVSLSGGFNMFQCLKGWGRTPK